MLQFPVETFCFSSTRFAIEKLSALKGGEGQSNTKEVMLKIVPYTHILYCLLFLKFASVIVSVGDPAMRSAFFVWI